MDNSFHGQSSDKQQLGSLAITRLRIIESTLKWLAGLMQLTEDEQTEAGIYLGEQHYL